MALPLQTPRHCAMTVKKSQVSSRKPENYFPVLTPSTSTHRAFFTSHFCVNICKPKISSDQNTGMITTHLELLPLGLLQGLFFGHPFLLLFPLPFLFLLCLPCLFSLLCLFCLPLPTLLLNTQVGRS